MVFEASGADFECTPSEAASLSPEPPPASRGPWRPTRNRQPDSARTGLEAKDANIFTTHLARGVDHIIVAEGGHDR